MLLVEFLSDDECRQYRSELYAYIQGFALAQDRAVRWITLECDTASRPQNYHLLEPVPHLARLLIDAARDFQPTVIVSNEKLACGFEAALRQACPGARLSIVGDDTPRYREIPARLVAQWLDLPPMAAESLVSVAVPDYASTTLNPGAVAVKHHIPLGHGWPCIYVRAVEGNPHFAAVDLTDVRYKSGCAFCLGHSVEHFDGAETAAVSAPVEHTLLQLRRFLETAPQHRRTWLFRMDDARLFLGLTAFFEGVLTLPLQPSIFHFARRANEFLARADELERLLPRLAAQGHAVLFQCMGIENFSATENERMNKGLTYDQIEAALTRLAGMEARFPKTVIFLNKAGFNMIVFTPWTTLDDLAQNTAAMRRLAPIHAMFLDASPQLTTRLILHPGTALTALAEHDGLVAAAFSDAFPVPACGLEHWDAQEVPWRFARPEVAAVYSVLCRLVEKPMYAAPTTERDEALLARLAEVRRWATQTPRQVHFVDLFDAAIEAARAAAQPVTQATVLEGFLQGAEPLLPLPQPQANGTAQPAQPRDPGLARLGRRLWKVLTVIAKSPHPLLAGYEATGMRLVDLDGDMHLATAWRASDDRIEIRIARDRPGAPALLKIGGLRISYAGIDRDLAPEHHRLIQAVARLCEHCVAPDRP